MGYAEIRLKIHTGYNDTELHQAIQKQLGISEFSYQIETKSLDARKKNNIIWELKIGVTSESLPGEMPEKQAELNIHYQKTNKKALVIGSGPAGYFAARILLQAGFKTTLWERGKDVSDRASSILSFEKGGAFDASGNYSFGEGGAGTFSDGKLTSRSKHISLEKKYILDTYVKAGAPAEITWLSHPHVGSDNLKKVVKTLRDEFCAMGGEFVFNRQMTDIIVKNGKATGVIAGQELFEPDVVVLAPGHSALDTYRMLMSKGVPFRTKNFAIGFRAEHRQEIINTAQWGTATLAGVKAAEYRLTSDAASQPVYTFCMCPGGKIVPAAAFENTNIVNGMSYYARNGKYANAACVAGLNPDVLAGKSIGPEDALNYLEKLEISFHEFTGGYAAPFCSIQDFIQKKGKQNSAPGSSYPLGLIQAPLWNMLPETVTHAIRLGLQDFCRKVKGYDTGLLVGLESKTSSPIQVVRNENGLCEGFENLYMAGEGSGYSGGIISSAADGIKVAMIAASRFQ